MHRSFAVLISSMFIGVVFVMIGQTDYTYSCIRV